jgi:hypothetical protein
MTLVISKGITLRKGWQPMDPDAAAYITAVETADTEPLEEKTKIAIDNFVLGCKADGIWTAIKASCILAGARTLTGALVPLVGTAPTNFNFASGDYNRKTGLVGNGSTKYLDSNRNNNADPQDSKHLCFYKQAGIPSSGAFMGVTLVVNGGSWISNSGTTTFLRINANSSVSQSFAYTSNSFYGINRESANTVTVRAENVTFQSSSTSSPAANSTIQVLGALGVRTDQRLAFYSIGESLDLALLDARVTDLINAFAAAIP